MNGVSPRQAIYLKDGLPNNLYIVEKCNRTTAAVMAGCLPFGCDLNREGPDQSNILYACLAKRESAHRLFVGKADVLSEILKQCTRSLANNLPLLASLVETLLIAGTN